jgi:CRISPR-associated protein Cmr6
MKLDIMNPHYPDYYGKGKPPADWQNPIPIHFLTVEETSFIFSISSTKQNSNLLSAADKWLKQALSGHGIGAKTSVGYGYFSIK